MVRNYWYYSVFLGSIFGLLTVGFLFCGGRQDEEHAASVRVVDARENLSLAQKMIKNFEEKYQVSFSDFERSLAQSCDDRLFDYAEWNFWERTLTSAQKEIQLQQSILHE